MVDTDVGSGADAGQAASTTGTAQRRTVSATDFLHTGQKNDSDIGTEEGFANFNLEAARRDRYHFDQAAFASATHRDNMNAATLRIAETASAHDRDNNQQVTRHNDLAIDRQWNIDEQAAVFARIIKDLGLVSKVAA